MSCEFDKLIMDRICNKLTEVENDGGFGISGKYGQKPYDGFIYPLVWTITKKVGNDSDDFFGSFMEYGC